MNILESIVTDVRIKLERRMQDFPESEFDVSGECLSLKEAILSKKNDGKNAVISEVKLASPSLGNIAAEGTDVVGAAREMVSGGACAISVLTEANYFNGSLRNLELIKKAVSVPVMRKDFIINEYQLKEAKHYGADAVLLIVAVLGKETSDLLKKTRELGMEALVEVHDKGEVKIAVNAGAEIIGINNRNLQTLNIDLNTTKDLVEEIRGANKDGETYRKGTIIVSESGIKDRKSLEFVLNSGADAALVGSSIMKSDDIKRKVMELVG